jgi:hypothetical protein
LPVFFFYDFFYVRGTHGDLLFTNLNDISRLERFVSRATLGVEELQQLLKSLRIGRVSQKGAFPADCHQTFVSEFVEVVGKSGVRDIQSFLDFADYQALRMRGQEQLHDSKPRLGPHRRKHVGIPVDLVEVGFS